MARNGTSSKRRKADRNPRGGYRSGGHARRERSDREDCQGGRRGGRHAIYLLRQQGRAAEPVISGTQDGPSGRHDDRLPRRQESFRPQSPRLGSLRRLGFGPSLEAESDEATGGV